MVEKIILLYMDKDHKLSSLFLDCESVVEEKVLKENLNFESR